MYKRQVQRQTHELAVIVVDDGNRIFKRIACTDGAAHRLLQGFQVVIDFGLLRMLPRCNFQHRQSAVSYTHLDVYKRQVLWIMSRSEKKFISV